MAAERSRSDFPCLQALTTAAETFLSRFHAPRRLAVALSGGADSRALLLAFAACRTAFPDLSLTAITIDHALRPGSAAEAEEAGCFAAGLGVSHRMLRWEGAKPATGLMAAARRARYRLLCEAAEAVTASAILTGHHADDQAETLAMRAARSAGAPSGIAPATLAFGRIWIARPFLDLPKDALKSALVESGLRWSEDPSNADPRFERARLRQAPVPLRADGAGARHALSAEVADGLARHVQIHAGAVASLDPALLAMGPTGFRALHLVASVLGHHTHLPDARTAERLAAMLATGQPGRITAHRCVFDRRRDRLYLYREARGLDVGGSRDVEARLAQSGLPPAIARRAAPALASLGPPSDLAPFAAFLPLFELPAAQALARLFDQPPFPDCPIDAVKPWQIDT